VVRLLAWWKIPDGENAPVAESYRKIRGCGNLAELPASGSPAYALLRALPTGIESRTASARVFNYRKVQMLQVLGASEQATASGRSIYKWLSAEANGNWHGR
jgi:hypothetical protein